MHHLDDFHSWIFDLSYGGSLWKSLKASFLSFALLYTPYFILLHTHYKVFDIVLLYFFMFRVKWCHCRSCRLPIHSVQVRDGRIRVLYIIVF
jgi:hypothetical protein